jgi:hypothetical protein
MAGYTAGELQIGRWVAESSYGTMTTNALAYMGELLDLKLSHDDKTEFLIYPGSRSFGSTRRGPFDKKYNIKCNVSNEVDWRTFWATYAYGSTTALTDHLGQFTALYDMYNGSAHAYQIMNGNKINKLTLSCEGPGQVIDFDADINCQWSEIDTDKAVTTIQAVTLGAEPATMRAHGRHLFA